MKGCSMYSKYIKRVFDLMLSGLGIVVLSPILLVLALIIKGSSKGPILFKQKRIGKDDSYFMIYKFRTMYSDTPKDIPTHLLDNPDAFITPIGHFLRKTSLDELPQLFNIFKGDMAVVGPRPALWNQYDLIELRDKNGASKVRPGLTGLAQISGRDELEIPIKAKLDGQYAHRISFGKDLHIFLATIFSVLRSDGVQEGKHE